MRALQWNLSALDVPSSKLSAGPVSRGLELCQLWFPVLHRVVSAFLRCRLRAPISGHFARTSFSVVSQIHSDFADSWNIVLARRSGPRSLRPHFAMHFRTIQVTQWHQHAHSFCFSDPKVNDTCDARDTVIHQWQLQVLLRSSAAIWMSQTSMAALVKMEAAGWACTRCPELKSSVFQGLKMSKSSC